MRFRNDFRSGHGIILYDLIREIAASKLVAEHGQDWPEPAKSKLTASEKVLYGFATCNGMNFMQLALLPGNTALYFYEGGIVFELRRR